MALIIKVLKTGTTIPKVGKLVSITRPGIIGKDIPSKKTNSAGCAYFDLSDCNGIVTIDSIPKPAQPLKSGENVFYD